MPVLLNTFAQDARAEIHFQCLISFAQHLSLPSRPTPFLVSWKNKDRKIVQISICLACIISKQVSFVLLNIINKKLQTFNEMGTRKTLKSIFTRPKKENQTTVSDMHHIRTLRTRHLRKSLLAPTSHVKSRITTYPTGWTSSSVPTVTSSASAMSHRTRLSAFTG